MITLRLDEKFEQKVNQTAKDLGMTKSELVRESLAQYINSAEKPSAWVLGESLFGQYGSGQDDLSTNRKALIKAKIKAKRVK